VPTLTACAQAYATWARWDRAADLYAQAQALDSGSFATWCSAIDVGIRRGDRAALAALCRKGLRRFGDSQDTGIAGSLVYRLLVIGDTTATPEQVARLVRLALERPSLPDSDRDQLLGMAAFRAGRFERALVPLTRSAGGQRNDAWSRSVYPVTQFFTAMALHHLHRPDAARARLAEGIKALDAWRPGGKGDAPGDDLWACWVRAQAVRAEAEALLGHAPKPGG
jgi:hypothetical protein